VKTIDLGTPGERQEAEVPELGLSEDVFADQPQASEDELQAAPGEPEATAGEAEAGGDDIPAGEIADETAQAGAADPADGTADEG
jgi:hypothetical protein